MKHLLNILLMSLLCLPLAGIVVACSESEDEEANEYANWQKRNDDYIADVARKCQRIKVFTKDQLAEGKISDYIYYQVLEEGQGGDSPYYSDTVRVGYRGRLIPTTNYPEGYVFDQTYPDVFQWQTTGVLTFTQTNLVDGFTTALQHMHRGDRWLVYIPYQLGYNTTTKEGIPAYSTLIFDIALIDFTHPGYSLPTWSVRRDNP
jgi:FKBP-type peptidyl-prolyl cis-trans isomerases 1